MSRARRPPKGEKGPDARRRPKAAREAFLYVERAGLTRASSRGHETAAQLEPRGANEADGPLSAAGGAGAGPAEARIEHVAEASPSMLKPKTAREMAAPGKMAIHGARCMKERPEPASMAPQDGRGGGTPRPRKESEDSARMTPPSPMVATMITVASRFGTTWRSTTRRCGVPMARA